MTFRMVLWLVLLVAVAFQRPLFSFSGFSKKRAPIQTNLLIVGGTESGWAAAIQAARMGTQSIVIVHDGNWLGGQFTEQALACVDENKGVGKVGWGVDWHPMKRSFHRSGLFKELMNRIESQNKKKYGQEMPGRPYHGPSTFRPAEAELAFRELLQPYLDSGQLKIFINCFPVSASVDNTDSHPRLKGMKFRSLLSGEEFEIESTITIDASDWGEAIQVAKADFEVGPDPQSRYGESEAPKSLEGYPANEMNPITWAMIVEERDGAKPIKRPKNYDDRCYVRTTKESLSKMGDLKWDRPVSLGSIPAWPPKGNASPRQLSVYNVRRVIDGYKSRQGRTVILLNYMLGQDYPLERLPKHVIDALEADEKGASRKNIVVMSRQQRKIIFEDAKQHALGVLYHLQNFVHSNKVDKTHSFRHFELSNEFGTKDRLPPKPYIRESLRLKAMYMMREQDGRNTNGPTKRSAKEQFATVMYHDGILAWQFHYDFHRTGRAYLKSEGNSGPWIDFEKPGRNTHILSDRSVFPMRSQIPIQMDGLIGAQKNLGYSSIVSAAIRLHDQCIHIGQAAGALAAYCMKHGLQPRQVPYNAKHLEGVRHGLCGGVTGEPMLLYPFRDLPSNHPNFVAINRLAILGILSHARDEVDFEPEKNADKVMMIEALKNAKMKFKFQNSKFNMPTEPVTRGEYAQLLFNFVENLERTPFPDSDSNDIDRDGVNDGDDALPFNAFNRSWPIEKVSIHEDGRLKFAEGEGRKKVVVNFNGSEKEGIGFQIDNGKPFETSRGFGWSKDVAANVRRRKANLELPRNSFVFTRTHDVWEYRTKAKHVKVWVCVGDYEYEQLGQNVTVEGRPLMRNVRTGPARFLEKEILVEVEDGRLTVEIGLDNSNTNTCLNWIQIEEID